MPFFVVGIFRRKSLEFPGSDVSEVDIPSIHAHFVRVAAGASVGSTPRSKHKTKLSSLRRSDWRSQRGSKCCNRPQASTLNQESECRLKMPSFNLPERR